MLDIIKKHLADYSKENWTAYKAALASDVVYEEVATQQRVRGVDAYLKAVQRWKRAFPDLRATLIGGVASGEKVVAEVEWEGTHTGPFEGPLGTIPATNRRGRVRAVLVSTMKDGQIVENHHYFDLLTILTQLGVSMPMTATQAAASGAGAPPPRHP